MRVYHDSTVPGDVLSHLRLESVQLVNMDDSQIRNRMSWRFLPSGQSDLEAFAVRDIDSRISAREASAVQDWEASGLDFHVLRDHPSHANFRISGGMWGGKGGVISDINEKILANTANDNYLNDMNFLNTHIWPIMLEKGVKEHDANTCNKSFPTRRDGLNHVGSVWIDGIRRKTDDDILHEAMVTNPCLK